MSVNQRIKILQEYYFPNDLTEFSKKTTVPKSTLTEMLKGENEPSFRNILKIIVAYPQINSDWLLLGEGEMLKPNFNNDDNTKPIQPNQQLRKKSYEHITNSTVDSEVSDSKITYSHYDPDLLAEIEALRERIKTLEIENAQLERMLLKK
jgi:hypothetical protein